MLNYIPVADVDADVNAYVDADDDVVLVLNMEELEQLIHDLKIDYLIHDEECQLDQLLI